MLRLPRRVTFAIEAVLDVAYNAGDAPVLLKTDMDAGHGGASGRYDALRETAFDYAFILWQLDRMPTGAPDPA